MKQMNKKKGLAQRGRTKLKSALLRCTLLLIGLLVGANCAWAQVYMHNGESFVNSTGVKFYDAGGPSKGPANYWLHWFGRNTDFTYTFRPETEGNAIQVDFESFTAYTDNNGTNDPHALNGTFAMRLNTAELYVYEGTAVDPSKLITTLTGTIVDPFTIMANGPITFRFKSYSVTEEGWGATVKAVPATDYKPQAPAISMEVCSDLIVLYPTTLGAQIRYTTDGNNPTATTGTVYSDPFNITYPKTVKAITVKNNVASTGMAEKLYTTADATPTPPALTASDIVRDVNTIIITPPAVPDHLNETYGIIYTSAGNGGTPDNPVYYGLGNPDNVGTYMAPDGWNGAMPGKVHFDWATPNTNFIFCVVAQSCAKQSAVCGYSFVKMKSPDPTIAFNDDDATISWAEGYTIRYTTNGTTPTTTIGDMPTSSGVTSWTIQNLDPGTTVKAIAFKAGDNNYDPSNVVSKLYLPGGDGQSGVFGNMVIIDDREDHNWSYYQASTNLPAGYPTSYLSSPDPRNVKITYKGGSVTNGSAVAISALEGEGQNQMLYLKTLEKTVPGMSGNYPYTVISNPFSKRPATGSGNNKTYYGFAGWKIVSGGEYIANHNNDDVLSLDESINFTGFGAYTPNSISAEVVFEATWTEATVKTGNSAQTFTGGTYETNFWVLTGNPNNNVTVPGNCTMTARYPDGTENWNGNFTRAITAGGNNAKVEFVNMNSTGNVSADGYTFTMGRGIVNSGNGGQLRGCTTDKACVHTVKIESGKYASLRHFTSGISASNNINQLMILGCDYDRARGWNNKLEITGSMYVAEGIQLNRNNNANTPYIRTYIKSGNFISSVTVSGNNSYNGSGGDQTYYYSISNTDNGGYRYLEVEGGHLRGIAGGMDYTNNQSTSNRSFGLRVRGTAQIDGVVYGAATFAQARGHRTMVFTGGHVDGWIAGGCNGTQTGSGGEMTGTSYVYIGGKTRVGDPNSTITVGEVNGGNVFGAGKGLNSTDEIGEVSNSNVVVADEATIKENVYGGGNYGYISSGGTSNLYILGGITANVFGGANRRSGETVNITMTNGTVTGNVYGGSNTTGKVNGKATIKVSGGTVNNVFGGGYGSPTDMAAGTEVNISGGTINNNVYGGGFAGTVSAGNTQVNISGGTMQDVYGAGKGEASGSKAVISGTTTVNVTGGTVANVYGGGENGNVTTTETAHGNVIFTLSRTNTGNWGGGYDNSGWAHGAYLAVKIGNGEEQQLKLESGTTTTVSIAVPGETTVTWTWHRGEEWSTGGFFSTDYEAGSNCRFSIAYEDGTSIEGNQNNPADGTSRSFTTGPDSDPVLASTVTINGGNVSGDVFGGGAYGTTAGHTIVNMKGGSVHGSVYGGALGEQNSVYVAGTHTVNVMGGRVYANVYGGSRNANDALSFTPGTFATATNEETVCAVNISGGQIDQQVYAAGYFGNCFGSVYAFVGKNAIYNAPNHVETAGSESAGEAYDIAKLYIVGSVWAGGDWGTFTNQFGGPTITGKSNVYVDGLEYNTSTTDKNNANYMCVEGSLFGSGTSCDAGKKEHTVMLRNYGESLSPFNTASRNFASIQRADYLVLDNVHVDFQGQGRINSLNVTEVYAIYEVSEAVIETSGSTLIMDAPTDQIKSFISASCTNVYTATLPTSETQLGGYTALTPSTLSATPNKVRVNGGNYIKIYHDKQIATVSGDETTYTPGYGMLKGYAYMMASSGDNEATCAYARPRWCTGAPFDINNTSYDNRNDGGWVSYVSGDNVLALDGTKVTSGGVQMEYENHTPGSKVGETYFRIWRTTGQIHEREGIFDVLAAGTDAFKYVDVEIELPAWRGHDYYYKFETTGEAPNLSTTTDYGTEVMTFNAALYGDNQWMYYDKQNKVQVLGVNADGQNDIKQQPDINFGLVVMPGTGNALSSPEIGETPAPALIINNDADEFLAKVSGQTTYTPVNTFTYTANDVMPTVKFRLTYSDLLSTNKTYEPMWVNLVQCDKDDNVKDIVKVKLVVNTSTIVGRDFEADIYAVMNGNGSTAEETHVQVVLPRFDLHTPGVDSKFTVVSIGWEPATLSDHGEVTIGDDTYPTGGNGTLGKVGDGGFNPTKFAVEFSATENYDGTTGWNELNPTIYDTKVVYDGQSATPSSVPAQVGTTGGRTQFSFDFNLYYNGQVELVNVPEPELMGKIVYNMKFTNYGTENSHEKTFKITLNVYRRGKGTTFYLDGVNGKNSYNGKRPDRAMYTLNGIFNRGGFLPGDEIYVVNQVTADDNLEWNGLAKGGQVKIYRYNGGHTLFDPEVGIIGNSDNAAYTGALVNVPSGANMIMRGIDLDGYYKDGGEGTVTAAAPLVSIENGGTLELNQRVLLEQNYNTNNGGAVSIAEGGTLMMNQDAQIKDNKTNGEGAGVYMNGTMIASDQVKVWDNKKGEAQNNVYLAAKASVLQIGVDNENANYKSLAYDAEDEAASAKIGLSKSVSNFTAGVAEVVYSEELDWLEEPLNTQAIIVHDGNIYRLETGADPNKLYWLDTWVTFVTSEPEGFAIDNIDSENDLAWVISLVNGENGCTADNFSGKTVIIKKDLDMKDHTWVPIGAMMNGTECAFKGTLEGNGHVVEGLISSLTRTDLGMFGIVDGATIQNLVAVADFEGVANNYGTIVGTMKDGVISNVEAAGILTGDKDYAKNIGGVVGDLQKGSVISAFAVNTLKGQRGETVIGGLVGTNAGNLFNSYANVTLDTDNSATTLGGLVGVNKTGSIVENCYVINPIGPAFAATNNGAINYCYAAKNTTNYVTTGTQPTTHGTYDVVMGRKEIGYMYDDNKTEKVGSGTNNYIASAISYNGHNIDKWPGLVSTLNQWVKANPKGLSPAPAPWFRPTSADINGDLPVLGFPKDNSMATEDGKFLFYGASDEVVVNGGVATQANNGLDNLFTKYNGTTAKMFLYGKAIDVTLGNGDNPLFINEDAVLLQAADAAYNITATTGITFDNSSNNAYDYYGNPLAYDWHFMSTPLANAAIGATYGQEQGNGNDVNLTNMTGGYFPNGLTPMHGDIKWDFYSYYEPEYHWINLKRTDHFHIDGGASINYTNETNFVPGKGYMMAISQDSYMSSTGTLNNGDVEITLYKQELQAPAPEELYNEGWNLVGNPYQAYLDLDKVGKTAFYIYDADESKYVPYANSQSTNPVTPSRYIHPHQGFFMQAQPTEDNTTETFTFQTSMATTDTDGGSYFRGDEDQVDYPLVNIFATNERGNRDLAIVEFNRPEIGGATKVSFMNTANFSIAAHLNGEGYGLLFTPEGTEKVPVHFKAQEDGTYTLTWSTYNGDFSSLLLVDNKTGVITDMLRADKYTFDATANDYSSRFYLTYAVTGIDDNEYEPTVSTFAYFDGSEWVVNGQGQLDVVDMLGRTLRSERLTNDQNRVSLNGVSAGVYLMRVTNGKAVKVQKIVVR